ncbi:MAG: NUDIX hydrolase [Terrimicrobiaceae bacterium]
MPNKKALAKKIPLIQVKKERPGKEVSAMGWIEDAHGRVLMVKQRTGRKLWALPGGKVRMKEALADALAREIQEETSLKVRFLRPCAYYDRHEKGNLTVLFRVSIREGEPQVISASEIESVAFRENPPRNSTPSLLHFWSELRPRVISKVL